MTTAQYPQASASAQGVPHTPHTPLSARDERRLDRESQARISEDHANAAQQRQFAAMEKAQELRAVAAKDKRNAKIQARQDRADQWSAVGRWCRARTTDLLMVPVIGVPGLLSWTGMADYGLHEYGPPGLMLPAFSEGAMWVFAAKTTLTRKEDEWRRAEDPSAEPLPVWHLRLGTVVFAGYGAALNFLHGMATGGPVSGVTMALVSVAGVTAHQLTTAGPRKTRKRKHQERLARKAARKEYRASSAAISDGPVLMDDEGGAGMLYEPGAVTVGRNWRLATELKPDLRMDSETVRDLLRRRSGRDEITAGPAWDEPAQDDVPEPVHAEAVREEEAARQTAVSPEPVRDDARPATRTDKTRMATRPGGLDGSHPEAPVRTRPRPGASSGGVDRDTIVAEMVAELRDSVRADKRWTPDHQAVMARTGFGKSWSEKAAAEARRIVLETRDPDDEDAAPAAGRPERTDEPQTAGPRTAGPRTDGSAETRTTRPDTQARTDSGPSGSADRPDPDEGAARPNPGGETRPDDKDARTDALAEVA